MDAPVRAIVYSEIPVWEIQVGPISVVRKQTDHSINLTHFLNVLGVHRQRREQFLAHYRSLPLDHCWVVHGGPARLKGTWGPFAGVKGLVAELGQQELFAPLLDELLVPDMALVSAVPEAALAANAGVPVIARRPAGAIASGSTKASPARPVKRQAVRRKRSGSTSSSDLTSISDSDLTDFDDDEEAPASRSIAPRRSGLRQHVPLRSGTRASARHVESRKGKEREQLAQNAQTDVSMEPTSSLDHVEELIPVLLPDVSVFQQLFGPSKSQNLAALAYLRNMKVPKLAPDDDDSDGEESMQETTPKDSITIDGVRIQGASSAGSDSSQHLGQPPPMPQSPSSLVSKSKIAEGALPMNLGQLFDLKLKQREAKLAAVSPPVRALAPCHRPDAMRPSPIASPAAAPKATVLTPYPVNFRKFQRAESEASGAESVGVAHPVGFLNVPYGPASALASPSDAPVPPNFLQLAPILPVVPAADYALAMTRCPPLLARLPN